MISMYNSLFGSVGRKYATAQQCQVCIELGGVEWICECSRTTLLQLPETGREARVFTYLIHREDQFYLCGFATEAERAMFLELITVDGIGARQALKILGSIQHDRLAIVLEAGDLSALELLPGVGKKTAQKMVLALKGKLIVEDEATRPAAAASKADLGEYEDLAQALVAMGYERKYVVEALKRLIPEFSKLPMNKREQELMRRAIIELS